MSLSAKSLKSSSSSPSSKSSPMSWASFRNSMALCIALRVLLAFGLEFYLSASATSFQQPARFSNITSDNVYYSSSSPSGGANSVVELITTGPGLLSASSPLTSYANLKEGMWLYRCGVDVYADGRGRVGVSPLYLSFSFLPSSLPVLSTTEPSHLPNIYKFLSTLLEIILWITPDALSAWFLVRIWRARTRRTGMLSMSSSSSTSTSLASSSPDILLPSLLPALYLLSPFHILPSLARFTSAWENAVLLGAVAWGCECASSADVAPKVDGGQDTDSSSSKASSPTRSSTSDKPFHSSAQSKSLLLLALRIHLSLDAIILLPPLVMLILAGPGSRLMDPGAFVLATPSSGKQQDVQVEAESKAKIDSNAKTDSGSESKSKSNDETQAKSQSPLHPQTHPILRAVFPVILEFLVYFAALSLVSTLIVGHWGWMGSTWGASLSLPSLTPNPGLWWYFFTEMFDHFRAFFLVVFEVHLLMYVAPICIKFQHDPLYALFLLTGILATFKPYPTLSDQGLFLVMWGIFGEVYPFLRTPLPALLTLLHSTLLQPLFAHLWLTHGRGNANFYYATTLVGACAGGMGVVDGVWGGLRCALEKGEQGKDSDRESVDEEWEESEVVTQQ
ncbi:GPI transamidase subunit PIG-U-domain-containing protein [Lentinula lateritia]|uniref:GPI transamidase subunit PIG-U-domain-containing protein n=1 Tax=Lentinula lateritia TaxID=40482 RepID=A0ABQ8V0S0_9AGAR|nr:GPI transamidase subunit PIG-U-domain-containing protein [Lentinula lateritia]